MNRGSIWLTLVVIAIVAIAGYYFLIAPSPAPTPVTSPPAGASAPASTPGAPAQAATDPVAIAAQDAQRLSDMHSLEQALAAYFKDHAGYPPPSAGTTCGGAAYDNVGGLASSLVPQYLKAVPKDPNPRACVYNYQYWSDGKNYAVLVNLQSVDPYKYNDHWCIGATSGTIAGLQAYLPCP